MKNASRSAFLGFMLAAVLAGCATEPAVALRPIENPRPDFGREVFAASELTACPIVRNRVSPAYPAQLRRAGIGGEVTVIFVVRPDGTVTNACVLKGDDIRLGDAAVAAVSRWRFEPGNINGEPVACWMTMPIVFAIHEG